MVAAQGTTPAASKFPHAPEFVEKCPLSVGRSSSTASTSNEPGPDVADYPYDTVPNKVDQLFRAQMFHDRKQYEHRCRQTPEWRKANPPVRAARAAST